ncbi:MAG: hypothetical protein K2N34_10565 [Lachnospiraceae bacterium]|nr:hypothetical protein [Lachnospiraceae bacterium]
MEVKMAQYNTTEDFSRVASDEWKYGDENDGFVLTPFARGMMRDAIRQAGTAFNEGREQIYLAMEVVSRVLAYALEEGRLALSKDQLFRGEGRPYILDIIEGKERREVPLRPYLEFGWNMLHAVKVRNTLRNLW